MDFLLYRGGPCSGQALPSASCESLAIPCWNHPMGWTGAASSITPTAPRSLLQTLIMLLNCSFRPHSHISCMGSICFMEKYPSLIPPYKIGHELEFRHTLDMDVPSHAVKQALHQPGTDPSSCSQAGDALGKCHGHKQPEPNWLPRAATNKQMGRSWQGSTHSPGVLMQPLQPALSLPFPIYSWAQEIALALLPVLMNVPCKHIHFSFSPLQGAKATTPNPTNPSADLLD